MKTHICDAIKCLSMQMKYIFANISERRLGLIAKLEQMVDNFMKNISFKTIHNIYMDWLLVPGSFLFFLKDL